jgi:hypothetical protein
METDRNHYIERYDWAKNLSEGQMIAGEISEMMMMMMMMMMMRMSEMAPLPKQGTRKQRTRKEIKQDQMLSP